MPSHPTPSDLRRAAESAPDFLLRVLDLAEESGEVDARQLADALGLTTSALRRALAEPAGLSAEHVTLVGGLLGVDAGVIRTLRRRSASRDVVAAAATLGGAGPARGALESTDDRSSPGAAPDPSIAAMLERVLLAIQGDEVGRALRGAVLDVAVGAARAAGRPLPPAAHQLRARHVHGGSGAEADARGEAAEDERGEVADPATVIAAAAGIVRELQRAEPGYDGLFAPVADDALERLLGRFGVVAHDAGGMDATARFALTPVLFGRHRLVRAGGAGPDQRRLVARAALGHLVAGHVSDGRPLASPAVERDARVADVVALADLMPFWLLADLRRKGRLGWRALTEHVAGMVARVGVDWKDERVVERAELRVGLFRGEDL